VVPKLERLSLVDELPGVANRRQLNAALAVEWYLNLTCAYSAIYPNIAGRAPLAHACASCAECAEPRPWRH
jgi:hypothetical protein